MQQLSGNFLSIMTLNYKNSFLVTAVSYLLSIFLVSEAGVSSYGATRVVDIQNIDPSSGKKNIGYFFSILYTANDRISF